MKKKMVVLLMLILSVSTAVLHGTCEEIQTIIAVVTTKKGPLKIRQEPSRNARELDEIARGTYVTILESGEEWCKVSYGIKTGYAMTCFLTIQENADADVMNYCTLQSGDCGDDVIELKKRLMELGYFRDDSKMTNRYNDTLVGRVKMFQRQNGFEETGIATPDMQVLLFSEDAKVNEEPLPKPPTHYRSAGTQTQGGSGWKKIVCPCCGGEGCDCCDQTGYICVPADAPTE